MSKRGIGVAVTGLVLLVLVVAIMGVLYVNQVPSSPVQPTGQMALPAVKEYGGAIRGVAQPGTSGFPGRAIALPSQDCYACSCPPQQFGITAADQSAAANACRDNCGGSVFLAHPGECSELESTRI